MTAHDLLICGRKWLNGFTPFFTERERSQAHCQHRLFFAQVEFCDNPELGETVDSFADWNDPHQVCIFVHESYNPESKFAAKIASHAKLAVPCLTEMYGSDVGLTRAESAPALVRALSKTPVDLDAKTIERAKQRVLQALRDPEEAVRINYG